jgi:hypothetical protein
MIHLVKMLAVTLYREPVILRQKPERSDTLADVVYDDGIQTEP